jgi:hypothetical protein
MMKSNVFLIFVKVYVRCDVENDNEVLHICHNRCYNVSRMAKVKTFEKYYTRKWTLCFIRQEGVVPSCPDLW